MKNTMQKKMNSRAARGVRQPCPESGEVRRGLRLYEPCHDAESSGSSKRDAPRPRSDHGRGRVHRCRRINGLRLR